MKTFEFQGRTYLATDYGNQQQFTSLTAAKKARAELRKQGAFPYLVPLSGSYYALGLANNPVEARELEKQAEEAAKERRRATTELVKSWFTEEEGKK